MGTSMAYYAGLFDCKGKVAVTRGEAILRVTITDKLETVKEIQRGWYGRVYGCTVLLTGLFAYKFLCAIQPHIKCAKAQVSYATEQWRARTAAKRAYDKLIWDSAAGMPARGC